MKETQKTLARKRRIQYRVYLKQNRMIILLRQIITSITSFGRSICQTWIVMGGWLILTLQPWINHNFCITTVILAHKDSVGVVGSVMEKLTSWHFTHFAHYFKFGLDKTFFLFNQVKIKVIGCKEAPNHDKSCSD